MANLSRLAHIAAFQGRVTVGVVGGGLAGLVAAEVLRQDGQAEVTVFERQRTSYADINARPTNGALAINSKAPISPAHLIADLLH